MKKTILVFMTMSLLLFIAFPAAAVEREERKWQDETIYSIMIDRFNNGDNTNDFEVNTKDPQAYHGGDFEGIIKQLDYIKDMGFTTILLSPVFDNGSKGYHGYWIHDFTKLEEHFGTMETFKRLVDEVHDRDMKIILDFVVDQVGPEHPWLDDSSKSDWFKNNRDNKVELENQWLTGLPDLNHENPEVREYLLDAANWWIEEGKIDGYRLNHVGHVPADFLKEFSEEVKAVKEDFYLLGEVRSNDTYSIVEYEAAGIDGFADYPSNENLRAAFAQPDQSMAGLFSALEEKESLYQNPSLITTFMDNHDTSRFTRDAVVLNEHPGARWRMALTYLYTTPGIPIVFYGSEIALDGGEAPENFGQMNFMTDKELVDYISQLGEIRGKNPSLARGSFELLHEQDGMAVFKREYEDEISVIAINNTSGTKNVTVPADDLKDNMELRGLLAGDLVRSNEGSYHLVLDREEAEIYVLSERTGINIAYLSAMLVVVLLFIIFIILLKRRAKRGTANS
ncbi:MAG: alpha-amylase family glycosyl hydrolase [Bacillota bacterium]